MELISLAVVAGAVGVSALVNTRTEKIVEVVEDYIKNSFAADDRLIVNDHSRKPAKPAEADLSLD